MWRGAFLLFGVFPSILLLTTLRACAAAEPPKSPDALGKIGASPAEAAAASAMAKSLAQLVKGPTLAKALAGRVEIDLKAVPLDQFADSLRKTHQVNVVLDRRALDDHGISPDEKLSIRLKHVPLRSALRLLLEPLELTYLVRDEVLLITTQERAEGSLRPVVYDVRDLLRARGVDTAKADERDFDWLVEAVTSTVEPTSWQEVGGPGNLKPYAGVLVVSQTDAAHEEIERLLALLRRICIHKQAADPGDAPLEQALEKKISLEFVKTPLAEAAGKLAAATGVDVVLDRRALEGFGLGDDTPVTLRAKDITLKAALRQMLKPADLAWVRRHGTIVITNSEEAALTLRTAVYDVRDLLLPEGAKPAPGQDYDYGQVVDLLMAVSPQSWDEMGGNGSLVPVEGFLVVSQGEPQHGQIAALLEQLRQAIRGRGGQQPKAADPAARALQTPLTFAFRDTPLEDALAELGRKAACRIVIDEQTVLPHRDTHSPVTLKLSAVSLAAALEWLLPSHLGWYQADGVIVVTTAAKAVVTRSYDLSDLLPPGAKGKQALEGLTEMIRDVVGAAPMHHGEDSIHAVFVFRNVLILSHNEKVHREVANLLAELRKARRM